MWSMGLSKTTGPGVPIRRIIVSLGSTLSLPLTEALMEQ